MAQWRIEIVNAKLAGLAFGAVINNKLAHSRGASKHHRPVCYIGRDT